MQLNSLIYEAASLFLKQARTQLLVLTPGSCLYVATEANHLEVKLEAAFKRQDKEQLWILAKEIMELGETIQQLQTMLLNPAAS